MPIAAADPEASRPASDSSAAARGPHRKRNTANNTGGVFNGGTLTLNNSSTITGNTASGNGGGGVVNGGTVTLNDSSSIHGNTANGGDDSGGGGIYNGCGGAAETLSR